MVAESFVVVASILAAFALDAWWDRRSESAALREALDGVRLELLSNRDLLNREEARLTRIIEAADAMLELMQVNEGQRSVEVTDSLAFLVSNWAPSLEVSLGAVDALVATGQLAEVGDPRLRLGLAGLRDRFADVIEDELVARQFHVEQFVPALAGQMDLTVFSRLDKEFSPGPTAEQLPVPHYDWVEYPNTRELRSILYSKAGWYGSARRECTALVVHLDELVAMTVEEMR
ncbi:MAG: hypothetical protein OEO79_15235 [Gemmatimonadota bacterium]|nr:hypothetical protein [Gemmatimonadota bacterium]